MSAGLVIVVKYLKVRISYFMHFFQLRTTTLLPETPVQFAACIEEKCRFKRVFLAGESIKCY